MERLVYRIPFGGETVEGPTIKCAMMAARLFGNSAVECIPVEDKPTHWTFLARFRDQERGVSVVRAFRQRKNQKTGMERKDRERAIDLLFQVGQSKAVRNVIVAAIPDIVDEMVESCKSGVLERINKNLPDAIERVVNGIANLGVDLKRVERRVGKIATKWLAPDVVQLISQISAINDGMASADELFPPVDGDAAKVEDKSEAKETKDEKTDKPKTAAKAKAEPKPEPKAAEPKSEPEPKTDQPREPEAEPEQTVEDTAAASAGDNQGDLMPDPDDEPDDLDFGDD